jgi:hypothetical protein
MPIHDDEAHREQRDGAQVVTDLADGGRDRRTEEQGRDEDGESDVRTEVDLLHDGQECGADAPEDHDDGRRHAHPPGERCEERGGQEQREERLEASHGPPRFPGRIGRL